MDAHGQTWKVVSLLIAAGVYGGAAACSSDGEGAGQGGADSGSGWVKGDVSVADTGPGSGLEDIFAPTSDPGAEEVDVGLDVREPADPDKHVTLCRPCLEPEQCAGGSPSEPAVCHDFLGDGSFCVSACDESTPCPEGYACEVVQLAHGKGQRCMPESGKCDCDEAAIEQKARTTCYRTNELGTCEGERRCTDFGLSACNAPLAAEEACNDKDDDCDGEVDEDFASKGEPCDGADEDGCEDGVWVCGGAGLVCDDPEEPSVEVCNGRDDDCDGQTDEGFEEKGHPCDGPDADLCAEGTYRCDGEGLVCSDDSVDSVEICNGTDDDCDGDVDEGCCGSEGERCCSPSRCDAPLTCVRDECVCEMDAGVLCYKDNLWHHDCRGEPTALLKHCGTCGCDDGGCKESTQVGATCVEGDAWFIDCFGAVTTRKQECGLCECAEGRCVQEGRAGTVCQGRKVHWASCHGAVGPEKEDCGA